MTKLRLEITKGESIRYISHLDYFRSIERALRRAKLPVAYSEGFNPHMKIAFASALSVGVTSDAEYLDVEMSRPVALGEFIAALSPQLPEGIVIKRIQEIAGRHPALMAIVNQALYRIGLPLGDETDVPAVKECLERFDHAPQVLYVKEKPKGSREVDIKQYLIGSIAYAFSAGWLRLDMEIRITPSGSIKPSEVLNALIDQFGLPVDRDAAVIHRDGLYVGDGHRVLSPLDAGALEGS